jgi:tRNA pseudouridine32 synthase/23S rRNA pseudouridine746 synthase
MQHHARHAHMMAVASIICRSSFAFSSRPYFVHQRHQIINSYTSTGLSVKMETRYQISACPDQKWVKVSFVDAENTTVAFDAKQAYQQQQHEQNAATSSIPDSVLQYERQLRKIQALDRASKTNVTVENHLKILHADEHLVVVDKPSGILCVPGVNKYRSLLDLVYETFGGGTSDNSKADKSTDNEEDPSYLPRDSMIVHRLDMDTSGVVVFARTRHCMSKLHEAFRERTGTKKMYEALLVGWLDIDKWIAGACNKDYICENKTMELNTKLGGAEIMLPLQRDHKHPPFMRVSTPESETEAQEAVQDLNHAGWKKIVAKKPKPSTTHLQILSHEKWNGYPVTRVSLTPITGRTHQLRVHCAAMGHPIIGDPAYGYCGEAHPNGGFSDDSVVHMAPTCASLELRRDIETRIRETGRTMCLHAKVLGFNHPATGEPVSFEAAPSF